MAIAMKQMLMSRSMVDFDELTRKLWEHSLHSAAAAYVLAKRMTRINPDEAKLAGVVHDLGAFYMLYRALQYPELRKRPERIYSVSYTHLDVYKGQSVNRARKRRGRHLPYAN